MSTQEYAIKLPFRISASGNVETTTSQDEIWADRVLSVIGTAISERVQRYYFGSRVHQEVWMNEGAAIAGIQDEIGTAFTTFLPLLTLTSVDTDYNSNEGTLSVVVNYRLPNNAEQTTQLGTVTINGNFPAQES